MVRKIFYGCLFILAAYTVVYFTPYRAVLPGYHSYYYTPEKYLLQKEFVKAQRRQLKDRFSKAANREERLSVLTEGKKVFRGVLVQKLFPYWYGTRWTFHGTTEVPGESSVACGYFVTTLLRDAGCKLNRTKLAQVASEKMIQSLVSEKNIKRYHNVRIKDFVDSVRKQGTGIYVVGLDKHTGFIVCENDEVSFVHSSGRFPFCVVKEKALESVVLSSSNYKVTGAITKDEEFLKRWLMNS